MTKINKILLIILSIIILFLISFAIWVNFFKSNSDNLGTNNQNSVNNTSNENNSNQNHNNVEKEEDSLVTEYLEQILEFKNKRDYLVNLEFTLNAKEKIKWKYTFEYMSPNVYVVNGSSNDNSYSGFKGYVNYETNTWYRDKGDEYIYVMETDFFHPHDIINLLAKGKIINDKILVNKNDLTKLLNNSNLYLWFGLYNKIELKEDCNFYLFEEDGIGIKTHLEFTNGFSIDAKYMFYNV